MSYRDLASSMNSARVRLAFNLARAYQAHLTGVCVMPETQSAAARAPGFGSPAAMSGLGIEGATPGGPVDESEHKAFFVQIPIEDFQFISTERRD